MNNLDKQYTDLLQDILDNGVQKGDRTGTGTISLFGRQIRHKMSDGFPLLTTKKMPFKTIVTELLWFLRGDTNIKYLVDNNCHIWDGDAYKRYLNTYKGNFELDKEEFINAIKTSPDFAKQWGELGPIYGKQWRSWPTYSVGETTFKTGIYTAWRNEADQIANLINDLKTNPDSRRLMVNAWNVGELDQMVLPPCHYGFQVYTRELSARERTALKSNGSTRLYDSIKEENYQTVDADDVMHTVCDEYNVPKRAISLMWNQRSVDTFLGLPFNIASYGLLLEIIAKEVNMVPDELIGNLGDTHLYLNHLEQAKEQIGKELSLEERKKIYEKEYTNGIEVQNDSWLESKLKTRNIPTRTKEPYLLPTLNIKLHFNNEPSFTPEHWLTDDFELLNYQSHPTIKAPLSN
jgi:thymidylate synthase